MTYENILAKMKARYRELSGFDADNASDIGIRLKIFAAETAEYYERLDELERQMFPQQTKIMCSGRSPDVTFVGECPSVRVVSSGCSVFTLPVCHRASSPARGHRVG